MRQHEDVRVTGKGRVAAGFNGKTVETGSGEPSRFDGVEQRRFVDQRAACRIDQDCALGKRRQGVRIDQASCIRGGRAVQREKVGNRQ